MKYTPGTEIRHKGNCGILQKFDEKVKKWEIEWISFGGRPVEGWIGWLRESDIEWPKVETMRNLGELDGKYKAMTVGDMKKFLKRFDDSTKIYYVDGACTGKECGLGNSQIDFESDRIVFRT